MNAIYHPRDVMRHAIASYNYIVGCRRFASPFLIHFFYLFFQISTSVPLDQVAEIPMRCVKIREVALDVTGSIVLQDTSKITRNESKKKD